MRQSAVKFTHSRSTVKSKFSMSFTLTFSKTSAMSQLGQSWDQILSTPFVKVFQRLPAAPFLA